MFELPQILEPLVSLFSTHIYVVIFIGLLFGGETVLVPAIFFAQAGKLELSYVVAIMILATTVSDSVWYLLGRYLSAEKLSSILGKHGRATVEKLKILFERNGLGILYFSKFVYGTRVAAQILSGIYKIKFRSYFFTNLAGIISLTSLLIFLASIARATVSRFENIVHELGVALGAFILIVVLVNIGLKMIAKKKWFL